MTYIDSLFKWDFKSEKGGVAGTYFILTKPKLNRPLTQQNY